MTSLRYLLTISAALLIHTASLACSGSCFFEAEKYYMYRALDWHKDDTPTTDQRNANNIKDWQRLTSTSISADDIREVVFKMPLEDYVKFYNGKLCKCKNKFARWIRKDRELLDYILLAKTNEHIRFRRNSRWYYPTMHNGADMTLEQVAEKAKAYKGERLRSRYLLQTVRALFTLGQYKECISLCDSLSPLIAENDAMMPLIMSYIAGAEARTGTADNAICYFAKTGDLESVQACSNYTDDSFTIVEAMEFVYNHCPYSENITRALHKLMRKAEIYEYMSPELINSDIDEEYKESLIAKAQVYYELYDLALKISNKTNATNAALWLYTAAFIDQLRGDYTQALRLARRAQTADGSDFIKESAKVMQIILEARLSPCNTSYDAKLYKDLKWIDNKLVEYLKENDLEFTDDHFSRLNGNISFCYWNDMMRSLLLGTVCPKMLQQGRYTRALQLANMADNRLLQLTKNITHTFWRENNEYIWELARKETTSVENYRNHPQRDNQHDYANHFFTMLDTLGADKALAYTLQTKKPRTEFDRFLNDRGYTNPDYLYDNIGTQCLRTMRYEEAVTYLGKVSPGYRAHLNADTIYYEPFELYKKKHKGGENFRFEFAREMASLKQSMQTTEEPNRKAMLMMRYATGLRNSFIWCWQLTQYYMGPHYNAGPYKPEWRTSAHTDHMLSTAEDIYAKALDMFTDKELAAKHLHHAANYKTLAEKFPDTRYGNIVKTQCDQLIDYHGYRRDVFVGIYD